jgi:uncharacterized sporulation protein YeaH/YhbH (DUF444 family)
LLKTKALAKNFYYLIQLFIAEKFHNLNYS